jgi:hypothetical protein
MTRFQVLTADLLFQCGCIVLSLLLIGLSVLVNFVWLILLLFIIWQWFVSPIIFGFSGLAQNFITIRRILFRGAWFLIWFFGIFIVISLTVNPFMFYLINTVWLSLPFIFYTISYFVVTLLDFFKSARQLPS